MTWLSDDVLAHLCRVTGSPDVAGTRYELLEKIGRGGMGVVYRAHDRTLDRPVALKVLHAPLADPEARLMREAHVIARLEHPGIVPVHDAGVLPDGQFYYAMKLVRGRRLDDAAALPAALAERLQVFQKICDAVAFAHAHSVLHRDLKPQNIMLGPFGEVLVLDWGLAREVGQESPATIEKAVAEPPLPGGTPHGTVLGTPGYMAPEQARGETDLDGRADVYALGGILHFLLTGRAPATPPVTPRRWDRSIPRPLEAVCLKALAAERGERYAAVAELAGDVAHFLAGRRVAAYPEGLLESARRLGTKYRAVIALVLAYLAMRIALLLITRA